MYVEHDLNLIEELKHISGSDLSTCMQCGACTAACGLSGTKERFPRKEMIWASWGLKNMLVSDADLWMCHQCGDCTRTCPRGVKPGDVLAALRSYVMYHYARPGFLSRIINRPVYLPLILLFPAIIISLILLLAGTLSIPEGPVYYSKFFPHAWLNISFTGLFLLAAGGMVISIRNFWSALTVNNPASPIKGTRADTNNNIPDRNDPANAGNGTITDGDKPANDGIRIIPGSNNPSAERNENLTGSHKPANDGIKTMYDRDNMAEQEESIHGKVPVLKTLIHLIPEILMHRKFRQCEVHRHRYYSHMFVFWGFAGLLFVTLFAILSTIFFSYPLSFWNPVKIAGNLGGLFLVAGSGIMIFKRFQNIHVKSNYADWLFLFALLMLGISGFFVEAARFGNWPSAYYLYYAHLILVWLVILYLPYTRFAHFVYRTAALTALKLQEMNTDPVFQSGKQITQ